MAQDAPSFSAHTVEVLRHTVDRLESVGSVPRFDLFVVVRVALERLARVDAFYVAFFADSRTVDVPYVSHHGQYVGSDRITYSDVSLSHYMSEREQTYRYAQDEGALVRRGLPIAGDRHPSRDAVAVPLAGTGDLMGFVCAQSDAAGSYDEEFVQAAAFLARLMYRSMRHAEESEQDLVLLDRYPQLDPHRRVGRDLSVEIGTRMATLRALAAEVEQAAALGDLLQAEALGVRLRTLCERYESELVLVASPAKADHLWAGLTPRQRQVAELVSEGLSNEQIARRLVVSVGTVKSHVSAILRRLHLRSRVDLRTRLVS